MIEELDAAGVSRHYLEKAFTELRGDPSAFLEAALGFLKDTTPFFSKPEAPEAVGKALRKVMGSGAGDQQEAGAAVAEVTASQAKVNTAERSASIWRWMPRSLGSVLN
jgi:hypothetical protein